MTVVNRDWDGVPIRPLNQSDTEAWLATPYYIVHVQVLFYRGGGFHD
jgi:hypothetical protein